jgi:phosphoribosyl-ATP pyrophosphohydrolase/phosphoribosyl-AMP cyclohydrolase
MSNSGLAFLGTLESIITARRDAAPASSYTAELFASGTRRIAQKVGEEAVEVALASSAGDREEVINETADLIYHLMVLLADQDIRLADIVATLAARHKA